MPRITLPRLAALGLLAGCAAAPFWGPELLSRLDIFDVERAEISGVQLLAPHEVLAASGLREGQSVWDDPETWLEPLRAHPVVRTAAIERSLPRTLLIRVEEHRPVALIEAGALRPATADGVILPVDPARAPMDLPLIRGAAVSGDTVADPDTRFLLVETARLAQLDPALLAGVSEIRRDRSGDLVLILAQPSAELLLPPGAGPDRLRQLRAVLDDVARRGAAGPDRVASTRRIRIDVRFADQVVVRFPQSS
jgi:cell division protein FtsQ